jgi:hypothetical protein
MPYEPRRADSACGRMRVLLPFRSTSRHWAEPALGGFCSAAERHQQGVPLSRWSSAELAREAVARGIVAEISGTTVWRWLAEDAIRPWNYRSWIFPRDPKFAEKAGRIVDLYEGRWDGERLHPGD